MDKTNKKIAIFEITLMVIAIFAFAYIIGGADVGSNVVIIDNGGDKSSKMIGDNRYIEDELNERLINREVINNLGWGNSFRVIYSNLMNYIFGNNLVSAADSLYTCLMSKDGKICQEYASSECFIVCEEGKCIPSQRKDVYQCRVGTCMDPVEGICQPGSPKEACESNGGVWYDDPFANNVECQKGCCQSFDKTVTTFVTDRACARRSNVTGSLFTFNKGITDQLTCLGIATSQEKSACIFVKDFEKTCRFTTEMECNSLKGNYTIFGGKPVLCTNNYLGVNCNITSRTTCIDGKDEIYFVDSCGNTANIYDSSKKGDQGYWNYVIDKKDSCGSGGGNMISASCGNCNYLLGSMCKAKGSNSVRYGDNICHDLNCKDDNGNSVKNGESWCLYDGKVGNGLDVVGSRYFKRVCRDGEVVTEACADFRNEICIQSKTTIKGENFKSAECRVNRWNECFDENTGSTGSSSSCTENPDCFLMNVDIDDDFSFSRCLPKYPEGFDLKTSVSGSGSSESNSYCSYATQTCQVVYKKKLSGWKCITNCNCEESVFTEKMNDFCIALGDCGGYVNILGEEGSSGYSVDGAPEIDVKARYGSNADAQPYQFIDSAGTSADYNADYASVAYTVNYGDPEDPDSEADSSYSTASTVTMSVGGIAVAVAAASTSSAFAGTAFAAAIAPIAGILAIVGVVLIIIAIVIMVMGLGKVKIVEVDFNCLPWQPPSGGDKCSLCMKDSKKPCSKYRCESLGLRCDFINEGTSKENCIAVNPGDASSPLITPLESVLNANYTYTNVSMYGYRITSPESDGCIPTFTPVNFGFKYDEPAQCKLSANNSLSFKEMESYLIDNYYLYNRTVKDLKIPSLESLGVSSIDPRNRVDMNLYVKCRDVSGNTNDYDYVVNFCIKPGKDVSTPVIVARYPGHDYAPYNATLSNMSIWMNEPATCRWDYKDVIYDNMNNSFMCWNNITQQEYYGWRCSVRWPVSGNETRFFIRCKDQPWDENINESNRNANTASYEFILKKTNELKISSLSPNNETLVFGSEPATVTLRATTSGGADGSATCEYKSNISVFINFLHTKKVYHEQPFSLSAGDHEINVRCEDYVGNVGERISKFNITIDTMPSKITRVYNSNRNLVVITDEPATCSFVRGFLADYKCDDFAIRKANDMSGNDLIHSTSFENSSTYYIKCKDRFENYVSGTCDAIVQGGKI